MVDTDKLTKERERAVKREEQKAGVEDGRLYRVHVGPGKLDYRWYQTELTFYPKTAWWVQEYSGMAHAKKIGKQIKLTDELKAKLEDWL